MEQFSSDDFEKCFEYGSFSEIFNFIYAVMEYKTASLVRLNSQANRVPFSL